MSAAPGCHQGLIWWVTIWVLWPLTHGYFSRGTALLWHNDAFTSTKARLWRALYMTLPSERYEGISSLLFHRDFRFSQHKFFQLGTCTGVRMLSSCWCSCYMHPPDPLMVVWRTALDKDSGWALPFPSPLLFPSMRTDFFFFTRETKESEMVKSWRKSNKFFCWLCWLDVPYFARR